MRLSDNIDFDQLSPAELFSVVIGLPNRLQRQLRKRLNIDVITIADISSSQESRFVVVDFIRDVVDRRKVAYSVFSWLWKTAPIVLRIFPIPNERIGNLIAELMKLSKR